MTPASLTAYLHTHIPLSRALGASIEEVSSARVVVRAPFGPNVNHRNTVFGGSLSALAILAGWSWLHWHTRARSSSATLVIQTQHVDFLAPAQGELLARCSAPAPAALARFDKTLARYQRARIELDATVESGSAVAARFRGEFVALDAPAPDFG